MEDIVLKIRRDILLASFSAGACHIGSALSCVDILVDLFYRIMEPEDRFIFAKASGAATLYAILCDKGFFPPEKLTEYLHDYPEASKEVPGVLHSVGSVGMGLSVAAGLALADRNRKVFCVISDGQLQEGVTYECALFAQHHKLTNLHVLCDNNGLQALGFTKDILGVPTDFFKETFPHFYNMPTIKGKGVSFLENKVESHYCNLTQELLEKALEENGPA